VTRRRDTPVTSEEARKLGEQTPRDRQELTCPRCGDDYANLPVHIRACNGGDE